MKLTADQLAKRLGISRAQVFNLKKAYPDKAPKSFGNVQAWKAFALANTINPDAYLRLLHR
ncbi:MAG: hypothetical protein QOI53_3314 [Verrucomicrobiota bacterium]|jgi:hypothetical protein|nr:hypothetical protein [Verrucomicrobiota bacterium]